MGIASNRSGANHDFQRNHLTARIIMKTRTITSMTTSTNSINSTSADGRPSSRAANDTGAATPNARPAPPSGASRGPLSGTALTVGLFTTLAAVFGAGCGPDFDPPSLIEKTRVLGARVEVAGAPDRAAPAPGETAVVTWLMTTPTAPASSPPLPPLPPLGWAFALCVPAAPGGLVCADQPPLQVYQGTDSPPRISVAIPGADVIGTGRSLVLYGRICISSMPTFNPQSGYPGCTDSADGTTASVSIRLQKDGETNQNPTAERGLGLDGQPWTVPVAGANPCLVGPRLTAGPADHLITVAAAGSDRESYTALLGDPPVATPARESLQISHFTTAGELKSPYSFVEAEDANAETVVSVKWKTPEPMKVTGETPVTFTFVVRDGRGGIDWTSRAACVVP